MISGILEAFAQSCLLQRDLLPVLVEMSKESAGMYHCPGRHAYRTCVASRDVCICETGTTSHQLIHVRCKDISVSQGLYGFTSLVIGEYKKNVGSTHAVPQIKKGLFGSCTSLSVLRYIVYIVHHLGQAS